MGSAGLRPALWVTLRGASPWVGMLWVGWLGLAVVLKPILDAAVGPAGTAVALLAVGWVLARSCPRPSACFARFHLDDGEVTIFGPGRRVERREWGAFESLRQGRHELVLTGPGGRVCLPLAALQRGDAWFAVLGRIVPAVAEGLWEALESGVVNLRPEVDPSLAALAWWAWVPVAAACGATADSTVAVAAAILAVMERGVALFIRSRGSLALHPGGMQFWAGRGRFVPWTRASVAPDPRGLRVVSEHHAPAVVPSDLPNFWAAAAVIHLRAQVGSDCPPRVHFRLRLSNGNLAVVGEIDAPH
jgi:hypothetical protein